MARQLAVWEKAVTAAKDRFLTINSQERTPFTSWDKEIIFVNQRMRQNEALQRCPPSSIQTAVISVATAGLSLDPNLKLAYLVPRDGQCTLDISYMGLARLAELSGAIRYVRAAVVREGEKFIWHGMDERPEHIIDDPFSSEEKPIKGVYCYVRLTDGGYLSGFMTKAEIDKVRQTSKAPNSPAWVKWYGEMAKKAIIKRESKLWPQAAREKVAGALGVLEEVEGLKDITPEDTQHYGDVKRRSEPKPEPTKDEPLEGEFEEVKDTQPARTRGTSAGGPVMSDSTRHIIARKLNAMQLGEDDLFKAMEVDGWHGLQQSDAQGCMDWISSEAGS
jgi:recombination protein RecT